MADVVEDQDSDRLLNTAQGCFLTALVGIVLWGVFIAAAAYTVEAITR